MEKIRNLIETKLTTIEVSAENGQISLDEIKSQMAIIESLSKAANYSEAEKAALDNRIETVINKLNSGEFKYLPVPAEKMSPIKKLIKKTSLQAKIAALVLATGLGGIAFTACAKKMNNQVETETVAANEDEKIVDKDINVIVKDLTEETEKEEMSKNIKEHSDHIINAANNALEAGINLTSKDKVKEKHKDVYAKILTNYYIVANIDNFTKEEAAEMFGEKLNPSEDLMESYLNYNIELKKHLMTVTMDNLIDYSNLYDNENDAKLLNKSERIIAKYNSAKTEEEKLKYAQKYYYFMDEALTTTEGNIAYSSQALDTFIKHAEAYDEKTRSKYSNVIDAHISDALEVKLNTAKGLCLGETNDSNIKVEESTISNLKSEFRIPMLRKLNEFYDSAVTERQFQISIGNTLNKFNSYENIVTYVKNGIDVSKYKVQDAENYDYVQAQMKEKGIDETVHRASTDSGISDGKNGNISTDQFKETGIDSKNPNAKSKSEKVIEEKTKKVVTYEDEKGNTVSKEAIKDAKKESEARDDGYTAATSGNSKNPGKWAGTPYEDDYNEGYKNGKAAQDQFKQEHGNETTTTFEDTKDQIVAGSTKTEDHYFDYTVSEESITNSNSSSTNTSSSNTTNSTSNSNTSSTTENKSINTVSNINVETINEGDIVTGVLEANTTTFIPATETTTDVISSTVTSSTTTTEEIPEFIVIDDGESNITEFGYTTESVNSEIKAELQSLRATILEQTQEEIGVAKVL